MPWRDVTVYTGIRCQPFFARGHTGCSFTWRIERNLPTYMSSGKKERRKLWLEPVRLEKSHSFGRVEIGRIEKLVAENAAFLMRSWHEYFGD